MANLTLRSLNIMSQMSLNLVLSKQDSAILDGQTVQTRRFVSRTISSGLKTRSSVITKQGKAEQQNKNL